MEGRFEETKPPQQQQQQKIVDNNYHHLNSHAATRHMPSNGMNLNGMSSFANSQDVLRSKIMWATNELASSNSVAYANELCQMIKSAADAISALKRMDTNNSV